MHTWPMYRAALEALGSAAAAEGATSVPSRLPAPLPGGGGGAGGFAAATWCLSAKVTSSTSIAAALACAQIQDHQQLAKLSNEQMVEHVQHAASLAPTVWAYVQRLLARCNKHQQTYGWRLATSR